MAKRKMTEDSVEFKIFMAVWNFWKNYGNPEDTDEYWDEVIKKISELKRADAFKDSMDLSDKLFGAILDVLDARQRSIRKFGDDKHGFEILKEDLRGEQYGRK